MLEKYCDTIAIYCIILKYCENIAIFKNNSIAHGWFGETACDWLIVNPQQWLHHAQQKQQGGLRLLMQLCFKVGY